jgi:hypothetical protein
MFVVLNVFTVILTISDPVIREVAVSHQEPPGGSDGMRCGVATAFGG